jgi:hypothetical protein
MARGSLQFDMKFNENRVASGVPAGLSGEGRAPAPDDFDVWRQDDAKERPKEYDRPESKSPYNHPHIAGRGVW